DPTERVGGAKRTMRAGVAAAGGRAPGGEELVREQGPFLKLFLRLQSSAPPPKNPFMATHITADCINCGACEPECPNEAISEGDEIYVIDPDLCTECVGFYDHEACQAVCPVECCLPNPEIVESEEVLIARAIKLHPDDE